MGGARQHVGVEVGEVSLHSEQHRHILEGKCEVQQVVVVGDEE